MPHTYSHCMCTSGCGGNVGGEETENTGVSQPSQLFTFSSHLPTVMGCMSASCRCGRCSGCRGRCGAVERSARQFCHGQSRRLASQAHPAMPPPEPYPNQPMVPSRLQARDGVSTKIASDSNCCVSICAFSPTRGSCLGLFHHTWNSFLRK